MDCISSILQKPAQSSIPVMRLSASVPVAKLGCAKGFVHKVKISPDVKPVRQKLRRLPLSVRNAVSDKLQRLLDLNVIERVEASHLLPHIDELMSMLLGATVFSTIYLENAYFQLLLHEESRGLTAFITHEGLFRFCRVPYGLASAPLHFRRC